MEKISALENEEASKQSRLKYLEKQLDEYSTRLAGYESRWRNCSKHWMKKRRT